MAESTILEEVAHERSKQIANPAIEDYLNDQNDWVAYITAYAGRAGKCFRNQREAQNFRPNMIKVAALAIAAIESCDKGDC